MVDVVTLYRKSAEEAPGAFKLMIIGTASARFSESDDAKKKKIPTRDIADRIVSAESKILLQGTSRLRHHGGKKIVRIQDHLSRLMESIPSTRTNASKT